MTEEYKVGYKKPPKHSQFKKGKSGNPKGRPKKQENTINDILEKIFKRPIKVSQNGEVKTISQQEAFFNALFKKACEGHGASQTLLYKLMLSFDEDIKIQNKKKKQLNLKCDYTNPIEAQKAWDRMIKATHIE